MEVRRLKGKRKKSRYLWVLTKAFLFAAVVIALSGCGMGSKQTEEMPQAENTPVPVVEHEGTDTEPKQTKKADKKEKKEKKFDPLEITKGDLESNFDEALKHVTIFGKKVSFPFTLDDLGKEFTFKKLPYITQKGKDNQGYLYYNGQQIADIVIQGGREKGDIRKKKIIFIEFCKFDNENVEFDICGVNFHTRTEQVVDLWGEGDESGNFYWENGKKSKYSNLIVVTGIPDGEVVTVYISYRRKEK